MDTIDGKDFEDRLYDVDELNVDFTLGRGNCAKYLGKFALFEVKK